MKTKIKMIDYFLGTKFKIMYYKNHTQFYLMTRLIFRHSTLKKIHKTCKHHKQIFLKITHNKNHNMVKVSKD